MKVAVAVAIAAPLQYLLHVAVQITACMDCKETQDWVAFMSQPY